MSKKGNSFTLWLTLVFTVIWTIVIALDYGNKHPNYYYSFNYFRYAGLYFFIFIIANGTYLLKINSYLESKFLRLRGLHIIGLLLIILCLILLFSKSFGETETSFSDLVKFWSFAVFNVFILSLFVMILRSMGQLIRFRLFNKVLQPSFTIEVAIGLMTFTTLLFFTAALGLLSVTTVLLFVFLIAVSNVTFLVRDLKSKLLDTIPISKINLMGWASFIFILFFLGVNFLSIHVPFPAGFDSRNVYVNISKIIAQNGSLVEGFQPYNWSLLMSVGFIMFDYVELALGLSFAAIVLSAIGVYEFSYKVLKLDSNKTLFAIGLFVVTPAIVNQMFVEIKVDFGMLFIQLASLIVFFKWTSLDKKDSTDHYKLLILLGLMCGFGMGVKLINMFLVFVLLALIWWDEKHKYSLAGVLLISLAILIFAGIDDLSGLQVYHKSINITSLVCGLLGLGIVVFGFIRDKESSLRKVFYSLIMGGSLLIMFSPWVGKNYMETKSLSPKKLILGKGVGPDIGNFNTINKNYKSKMKENKKKNLKDK